MECNHIMKIGAFYKIENINRWNYRIIVGRYIRSFSTVCMYNILDLTDHHIFSCAVNELEQLLADSSSGIIL